MSTDREQWERLDTPAVVPGGGRTDSGRTAAATSPAPGGPGAGSIGGRPLRLRRSRSPVLAALDAGGSMLARRGRDVLVGSSILLLPLVALNLWATAQAFDRNGSTTLTAFGGDDVGTGLEDVAALFAVVCASLAAATVGCFAAIVLISDQFGRSTGLRVALRDTLRRLPTVVVAWAVGHAWLPFFVTWSLSSPSGETSGRLTLVLPVSTFCAMATLLVVPVIVGEQLGPFAAIRRSWRLMRLRTGSSFAFVCASTIVGALLLAGITFLPALAEAGGFITFGDQLSLVQGVASQIGVIIVVPLIALATAHFYLLVRVDAEGLDIVLDADAAFGPRISDDGRGS